MAIAVCYTCDEVCEPYFTCEKDKRDYCLKHREHGYHECVRKPVKQDENSKTSLSLEAIVKFLGGSS